MKEMIKEENANRGGSVKRTLLIAAMVAVLLIAFAGPAFAAGINHSGQTGLGAHGTASVVDTAVSGANVYFGWNASLGGNLGTNSPHGNYTTTTVKCVVCHAVHYAGPGNATVASNNQDADTLLRMRADQACVYCHATAGMAVNGRPVYDGLGNTIVGAGNTGGATNNGHITGTNCSYCHTNVHGANGDHSVASLDGYLLKLMPASNVASSGASSANMIQAITAIDHNAQNQGFAAGAALGDTIATFAGTNNSTLRERAVGVFCAECHVGSYAQAAAGAATNVYQAGAGVAYSGHRIMAPVSGSAWNATGNISSGAVRSTQVAWAPATNCKSCHDATDDYGNAAFPHSWGGTKMWLMSAADASATPGALPYGTASGASYDASSPQLSDGVCLKCHVASGGTAGVGISF
jgi:hypothetical protein